MIEITGDLWEQEADAICITTNGFIKKNGEAVMGRGCALEAATRYPDLPRRLGHELQSKGNQVFLLKSFGFRPYWLLSFPVKHHWREKADLRLIEASALKLVEMIDPVSKIWLSGKVILPRPGCGNGQLEWEDVKPILEPILDDRFFIISKEA